MARSYKRDARGRFASGGGGGNSGGGAKVGRSGPRGGKVGTRTEQRRNAKAQAARSAAFSSKSTAGRSAKAAYKEARSAARWEPGQGRAAAVRKMENARSTVAPKRGRPAGASGGKVGSSYQQKKNAAAQSARNKQFSSKATVGRSAKAAYKEARSAARWEPGQGRAAAVRKMEKARSTTPKPRRRRS